MKSNVNRRALNLRLKKIRCLLLDVDGVLTDGKIHISGDAQEFKSFDIQDGHGIALATRAGIIIGFVSGRPSKATEKRAAELGVNIVRQSPVNKMEMVETIKSEQGLKDEEICFVGDDLVDLPVLRRVGFAVAVANAVDEVKAQSHYVTSRPGGQGAVREVIEMILKGTGNWQKVIAKYLTVAMAAFFLATAVQADSTNDLPQTNSASGFVEKFEFPQRDEHGNLQWKLSGDRGYFRTDGLMDIINARAEMYTSNKVTLVFTTPICVLDRANSRAATEAPVRVERDDMILTGIGGDWSGSNTTVIIRHNVQMLIKNKDPLTPPGTTP